MGGNWFESLDEVPRALRKVGYLADDATATSVFLASRLEKPLLIEGPAGTGKTDLARALAEATRRQLIRLQCYEGLDESKVLYEWNYRKQLLWLQAERLQTAPDPAASAVDGGRAGGGRVELEDIFSEPFLLERPVLQAIRSEEPSVLLIDEIDRIEMETEALLLEVLSDYQVTIPELGTVRSATHPFTILTSNATRELSEALKRRCLYLWLDYPSLDRERTIVLSRIPEADEVLADRIVRVVRSLRGLDLKKSPSIAETLDWARTLVELGIDDVNEDTVSRTIGTLLKHPSDIAKARSEGIASS
ncbi:MAG: AAA family ATPase [Actinomycetota bacterium]